MIAPRWRKVLRDVAGRPARSLLVIGVLASGVFEIGALAYKYALLSPALGSMYEATRPASAVLATDRVDDALVARVRRVPGVGDAEARPVIQARVRTGPDTWKPAVFYVVRDFGAQRLDRFRPESGAWPPSPGDVLLERTALAVAGVAIADSLPARTRAGDGAVLRVAGTVHAPGLPPAWMEHMVPGFVGWNSVLRGGDGESAELRIRVAEHALAEGHVREVADSVRAVLERSGHPVTRVTVPPLGRHPHADQMDAFLFVLAAFAVAGFVLASVLAAHMVHALLAGQVRQIGVMKAVGASVAQVARLYLAQVALLAAASLALGLPPAIAAGSAYARFSATILNTDVSHAPFPWAAVLAVAAAGLIVPLACAAVPVVRAARLEVRAALDAELPARPFGTRRSDRWLTRAPGLGRPLALTLRTACLHRGRLVLAVVALAAGGGAYLAARNLSAAWTHAVERDFARRRHDLTVSFAQAQPVARIEAALAAAPAVTRAVYWPETSGYLIGPGGVPEGGVSLLGVDPADGLLDLDLLAGRAPRAGDTTGAVVTPAVVARHPGLRPGATLTLRVRGRDVSLPVVGVARELVPMPVVYAAPAAVRAAARRGADSTRSARIVSRTHDAAGQQAAAREVERAFAAAGIEVASLHTLQDERQSILDHLVIILSTLTFAAGLVVLVGGLGLASALALGVVQRTREIGVLGAIGASPAQVARLVWAESLLLGLLAWLAAHVLAVPFTWALETACGRIFVRTPLPFSMSASASAEWLALTVVLASLASLYPAARAARLTVREALSHA